ncbi:Serine/threonine-protein phosphatase 6 regulatory ankyrin repeat subunit C (PP6-ARS-C) (Serine/threonine-protein phosphatase 6 regulatory subunit ARS-C) [Durusdinium trenchii]|uniref:receptor protein-tyrosine kinase n=1 Tax=Durusdinium trenchii TaxID=1381693 RepID=A0ABP0JG79_9DINO
MLAGWRWSEADEAVAGDEAVDVEAAAAAEAAETAAQFQVPPELESSFTPEEVEQAILLFEELDQDQSGFVDVEELRTAFDKMGEEVTDEQLEALLDEVDDDGSGAIDFGEFLKLLSIFKSKGSKFAKMAKLFDGLGATPLAVLENECSRRGLEIQYKLLDVRKATSMFPTQFVMGVEIHGTFKELEADGGMRVVEETRKFEGIGKNTRLAKFNAATTALTRLKAYIPGIDVEPGEIPQEWLTWFEENLDRGVDELKLLEKLTVKGFFPCKNILFMQKLSLRVSMLRMQAQEPGLWPSGGGRELPVEWTHWAQEQMKYGFHGKVILDCLVENGFVPKRNPLLSSLLRRDEGGTFTDSVHPKQIDFWSCAGYGYVRELERFVAGGQDPNELKAIKGHDTSALALAVRFKQLPACEFLVGAGADVNTPDKFGRVACHAAAQAGDPEVLQFLISKGGDVLVPDRYGDTPLHIAASHGYTDMVEFLLEWNAERVRRIVSGKDVMQQEGAKTFKALAKEVFDEVMSSRISRFSTPHFRKTWMFAAYDMLWSRANGKEFSPCVADDPDDVNGAMSRDQAKDLVIDFVQFDDPKRRFWFAKPQLHMVQCVMSRFDLHPENDCVEFDEFFHLVDRCLATNWINSCNSIGRTPIMCSAEPSSGTEISEHHERILELFSDDHGCDTQIRDKNGKTVLDMIRDRLAKLGDEYLRPIESAEAEREQERLAMAHTAEPFLDDPLYLALDQTGEIKLQWKHMLSRSSRLRQIDHFAEMLLEQTGQLFYCDDVGRCQWSKPQCVVECDHLLSGWAHIKVNSRRIQTFRNWDIFVHNETGQLFYFDYEMGESQWERPPEIDCLDEPCPEHDEQNASLVCQLGFWEKWRLKAEPRVYYRNSKRGLCQFERPLEWSEYADPDDVTPESYVENWETLCLRSERCRTFGPWEERKELATLNFFYWNSAERRGSWERPREVLEVEQGFLLFSALRGREQGRERKRLRVLREALDQATGLRWAEEQDIFKDPREANGKRTMTYYVGVDDEDGQHRALGKMPRVFASQPETSASQAGEEKAVQAKVLKAVRPVDPTKAVKESSVLQLTAKIVDAHKSTQGHDLQRIMIRLQAAEERVQEGYVLCSWGCKEWIEPQDVAQHQNESCLKRQIACDLECGLVLRAEQWAIVRETHNTLECPKRVVPCDRLCGEMIVFEKMAAHLDNDCSKRSVAPLPCKNDCGWQISGGLEDRDHMAWEASQHEEHMCPLRKVRCDWAGCAAELQAKDLAYHRQDHLKKMGIETWTTAGSYKWRVPRKCRSLLVHLWGAGGGSGQLKDRRGGHGGGGAFVEVELAVHPMEELILVVGSGGQVNTDQLGVGEQKARPSPGGFPGGGDGMSFNATFSCGGGGGYSALLRQGAFGEELLALAAGGGGGGSRNGNPGGDETFDPIDFDGIARNGGQAAQDQGGQAGESPEKIEPKAAPGIAYQGGHGAQFGGGGGGGLFGGGGGGFTPGVVGGGGGGSSFVERGSVIKLKMLPGVGLEPGGRYADLPAATGVGEWDLNGRFAGFGGTGSKSAVEPGCNGAIRIRLPRYFETDIPERRIAMPDPREESANANVSRETHRDDADGDDVSIFVPNNQEEIDFDDADNDDDETGGGPGGMDDASDSDDALPAELLHVEPDKADLLKPGARILCNYQGKSFNPKYPGVISDVNHDGTYEIEYDDGDTDSSIPIAAVHLA